MSADLLDFMQVFLKARPHLSDNDFFITGESYAGCGTAPPLLPARPSLLVEVHSSPCERCSCLWEPLIV